MGSDDNIKVTTITKAVIHFLSVRMRQSSINFSLSRRMAAVPRQMNILVDC